MDYMHRLHALGPPRLERADGTDADLALGKPFAVLVFVALSSTPPSRAELARLFWPDSDPKNARQSVRQTLWILRRALGADAFASDDPVALSEHALETDVADFRAALAEGEIEEAEALWRGRFMQEFALPDAPEWTRWVEELELALEAALVPALAVEADALRQRGEIDRAVERLERAIVIDPYRESLHEALLVLYLESGQLSRAAEAIGRAREALGPEADAVREMGERLERRLHRSDPSAGGTDGNGRASDPSASLRTELVGRTREMAILLEAWRGAASGGATVTVLTGPAGVGKTRLTEELEALVSGDAVAVRLTGERSERSMELGFIAELARRLAQLPGADELDTAAAATLRCLSPAIPLRHAEAARELEPAAVAGSITNLLACVAREQPLLLILDEGQWIDEQSRAAISRVARSLDGAQCGLVVCLQDEEMNDSARDFASALGHAERPTRLTLAPLSDTDVREMIALMVEFPDENGHEFRGRLARAAGGNPLYLFELLRALLDDGVLEQRDGLLHFAGDALPDPLPLPRSVQELLQRRLASLSDSALALAGHLARMGGKGRLEEAKERSGLSEGELARAAGELIRSGVALWTEGETLRFAHDRLRRTVLDSFPVTENGNGGAHGRSRWSRWKIAAAVAGLLALPASYMIARGATTGAPSTAPYGGGHLLVTAGDTVVWELAPDETGTWQQTPADLWHPPEFDRHGPYRLASGDTVWYVFGYEPDEPPSMVEVRADGSREELVRIGGDVNLPSLSPGGRFMTYKAQNVDSTRYVQDIYVARADGTDRRVLLRGSTTLSDPQWSPNGRYIASRLGEIPQRIVVLTPGGEEVAELPRSITNPYWCGGTDTLLAVVDRGAGKELATLDARTGIASYRPIRDLLTLRACSPDGSAAVYERAEAGERQLVLHDLRSDEIVPLPPRSMRKLYRWIPDRAPIGPVEVRLDRPAGDDLELPWGESSDLGYTIVMSDSSHARLPVRWTSTAPNVASVSDDGRVAANAPGSAWISATLDGWLADSVEVRVTDRRPSSLLFDEQFEELGAAEWISFGYPLAQAVTFEGAPALSLRGDGRYADGITTRTKFPSESGLSLEAEFRLSPTKDHHQRWALSLMAGDPLPGREAEYPMGWTRTHLVSAQYPASELARYDPSEIRFGALEDLQYLELPELLPRDGWIHVALQLRPDGIAQLYLDRRLVATSKLRVPTGDGQGYRVVLTGDAEDTEAYVRDLRVWAGVRY